MLSFAAKRAVQAATIDAGFAAMASANGTGRRVDAKQAWRAATDAERRHAQASVDELPGA